MSEQDKQFNKAVKNTKAYEELLIRLITLECAQDIHTETEYRWDEVEVCLNCGCEVKQ